MGINPNLTALKIVKTNKNDLEFICELLLISFEYQMPTFGFIQKQIANLY